MDGCISSTNWACRCKPAPPYHYGSSTELFRKFTAQIRAPITIYVATYGIGAIMPPGTDVEKARDLGASMVFDKYSVVSIPGDHVAFLDEEELHRLLLY
jgi:hypothetical protein